MHLVNKKTLFLSSIVLFFLFSCKKENIPETKTVHKVEAVQIHKEKIEEIIKSPGTLNYKSKHNVSSLVSGRLEKLNVHEGDYVFKGQILGELRNIQLETQKELYENNLLEEETALEIAENDLKSEKLNIEKQIKTLDKLKIQIVLQEEEYEQKKQFFQNDIELNKIGGISDVKIKEEQLELSEIKTSLDVMKKEFEISSIGYRNEDIENAGYAVPETKEELEKLLIQINAVQSINLVKKEKTQVDNARKNLINLENLMEELKIKASVSGIIGACSFQTGDYIDENEVCFLLIDTSALYAVFYVQEQDIWKYELKTPIEINIPSLTENLQTFITDISPVADSVSGNFCLKAEVKNQKNKYKPGMFANCILMRTEAKEYAVVPESCVLYSNDENPGLFCIIDDHIFFKNVKILLKRNGKIYISEGINENDYVVNHPSVLMKEGDMVETE